MNKLDANELDQAMPKVLTLSQYYKSPAVFATTFSFPVTKNVFFFTTDNCQQLIIFPRAKRKN